MAEAGGKSSPWGMVEAPEGTCLAWNFGSCELRVQHRRDEWLIAAIRPGDTDGSSPETRGMAESVAYDPDLPWTRYVTVVDDLLEMLPCMPDRAVVVRPDSAITILPGRSGQFYFTIPVWVRLLSASRGPKTTMAEIPTIILSNTWFGDPSAGELCYSLDAPLRRTHDEMREEGFRAICPIHVKNGSHEELSFQRVCVQVEHLSLYRGESILWSNEVHVLFKGSDQISQITYSSHPPTMDRSATLLTGPRTRPEHNILRRSFGFIRQFTGL